VRQRPKRGDTLVAGVPEPEALEQHPDSLGLLGDVIEPAEERQVLERRQLPINERIVTEIPNELASG
jgi:hypothetical protein